MKLTDLLRTTYPVLTRVSTTDLELFALRHGYRGRSIYGAIGYLRKTGRLQIIQSIKTKERTEHLFVF